MSKLKRNNLASSFTVENMQLYCADYCFNYCSTVYCTCMSYDLDNQTRVNNTNSYYATTSSVLYDENN